MQCNERYTTEFEEWEMAVVYWLLSLFMSFRNLSRFCFARLVYSPNRHSKSFCHICYEYISVVHWYMAIFYLRGAQYCSLEVWVATVSSQTKGQLW